MPGANCHFIARRYCAFCLPWVWILDWLANSRHDVAGTLAGHDRESCAYLRQCLWAAHGHIVPIFCWIDNAFFATRCLASTFALGCAIESYLKAEWQLSIKPTSRLAMPVANAVLNCSVVEGWKIDRTFPCLGFLLDAGSGLKPEVCAVKDALRGALWRNLRRKRSALLPQNAKIGILQRAILPVALYRWTRWVPSTALASYIDKTQRQMLTPCIECQPVPHESAATFVRRRGRLVTAAQNRVGKWSDIFFKRVVKWADHLRRDREHPVSKLVSWHDAAWLQNCRHLLLPSASSSNFGLLAGRTGTRRAAGIVHERWENGVKLARRCVADMVPS